MEDAVNTAKKTATASRTPWRPRRVLETALCVLVVVLSISSAWVLIVQARAEFAFEYSTTTNRLALAPELDPAVADYAKTRGDFWLKRSIPPQPQRAAIEYRRALELNPREAFHWSDWAEVCARLGQTAEAKAAFQIAARLDPNNHVIQQEVANFFLVQGHVKEALPYHARAIALKPSLARSIYPVYWNLGLPPAGVAEELLGNDAALLRQYFRDCLTWVSPEQAEAIWRQLEPHEEGADLQCHRAYFDFLVANHLYGAAKDLWRATVGKFYHTEWDERTNAFWNGRFEHALNFDGGLEWRIDKRMPKGVSAVINSFAGIERSNCLWIHFDGSENVAFSHVSHGFFVEPEKTYQLRYWVRAVDVTTDSGPYVELALHSDPPLRKAGEMIRGTGLWQLEEQFQSPSGCHWAEIVIRRNPITKLHNRIKGDVYFSDFTLQENGAATETLSR